ncbi:hypothetical protein [Rhodospirillaceae bacterium SYSU D60014]|uniref:hypothetical protein n=1 Tax=Virgifigura deserti TaxID=2268457 RepID=UPI0013C503F3
MPRKSTGRPPGRPPRAEKTTVPFSIRMDTNLRAALEREAKKKGQSLREEIEHRLRNSFEAGLQRSWDERLSEMFGGRENLGLMLAACQLIRWIEIDTGRPWHADAFSTAQVSAGVAELIKVLGTKGDPSPPDNLPSYLRGQEDKLWEPKLWGLLEQIRMAPDQRPEDRPNEDGSFVRYSDTMKRSPIIKQFLGSLVDRLKGG